MAGKVTTGLTENYGSLPPGEWLIVTCGLTVCTPGSAPGTMGELLPFTFFLRACIHVTLNTKPASQVLIKLLTFNVRVFAMSS